MNCEQSTCHHYQANEKLPADSTMILADTGHEWLILMFDEGEWVGYEWEDDQPVKFARWANLEDLNQTEITVIVIPPDKVMQCPACGQVLSSPAPIKPPGWHLSPSQPYQSCENESENIK